MLVILADIRRQVDILPVAMDLRRRAPRRLPMARLRRMEATVPRHRTAATEVLVVIRRHLVGTRHHLGVTAHRSRDTAAMVDIRLRGRLVVGTIARPLGHRTWAVVIPGIRLTKAGEMNYDDSCIIVSEF